MYVAFDKNSLLGKQVVLSWTDLWATGDGDRSEDVIMV